jgi:chromosome segregation ATPase
MSETEILKEILVRLGGLEQSQARVETRLGGLEQSQARLEESHARLERVVEGQQGWFQTLGQKVETLTKSVDELRTQVATDQDDLRQIVESTHDDSKIHRRALADLSDQAEDHEQRLKRLETPATP